MCGCASRQGVERHGRDRFVKELNVAKDAAPPASSHPLGPHLRGSRPGQGLQQGLREMAWAAADRQVERPEEDTTFQVEDTFQVEGCWCVEECACARVRDGPVASESSTHGVADEIYNTAFLLAKQKHRHFGHLRLVLTTHVHPDLLLRRVFLSLAELKYMFFVSEVSKQPEKHQKQCFYMKIRHNIFLFENYVIW